VRIPAELLLCVCRVRACQVAHGNTARFAKEHGDDTLSKVRRAAWQLHRTAQRLRV
jgi:hypothetical protein